MTQLKKQSDLSLTVIKIFTICFFALSVSQIAADTSVALDAPGTSDEKAGDNMLNLRDPFWPVNYTPSAETKNNAHSPVSSDQLSKEHSEDDEDAADAARYKHDQAEILKSLKVEGVIRRGNRYYATVNGQMVEAGEVIPVLYNNRVYRFLIRSIKMGKVSIEPLN